MTSGRVAYLGGVVVRLDDCCVPLSGSLGSIHLQAVPHQNSGRGQQDFLTVLIILPRLYRLTKAGTRFQHGTP